MLPTIQAGWEASERRWGLIRMWFLDNHPDGESLDAFYAWVKEAYERIIAQTKN